MSLAEKILALYPDIDTKLFIDVIIVKNDSDGKGDYIAKWEHPTLPKPTEEALANV